MALPLKDLRAQVLRFLTGELKVPGADLHPDAPLVTTGLLDSVALVRLAAFLERRLGIHIPDRDITVEHFESIRCIEAYVERRRGG